MYSLVLLVSFLAMLNLTPISLSQKSSTTFSVVQSGSQSTSAITLGPNPDPVGSTVKIDLRIDNSPGIWGWILPTVTWNSTVMNLIKVEEGPFLSHNSGEASPLFIGDSGGALWDNVNGVVNGGFTETLTTADKSTDSSGVLATLTFTITAAGNGSINISGGNIRLSSADTTGQKIVCQNTTITVLSNNVSTTPSPSINPMPTPTPTSLTSNPTASSIPSSSCTPTNIPDTPTQSSATQTTDGPNDAPVPEFPIWIVLAVLIIMLPVSAVIAVLLKRKISADRIK